jgi:mannose-6-phosphate isomerase
MGSIVEKLPNAPIRLPSNQPPDRFYKGGTRIAAFRGVANTGDRIPEDWIGSVTSVRGEDPIGRTLLPDGRWLADAIEADPNWWLGEKHVAAFGNDVRLLTKLLDPGQRLPVHAHPSDDFAREFIGTRHGKAEAWYILAPGTVHLGLTRDVSAEELYAVVREQDIETLLGLMHSVHVQPGDRVYVPPGLLHAIGEGVLLAEVQEPEDLSILLEWSGFAIDGETEGHLGLGFEHALSAVEMSSRSAQDISSLVRREGDGAGLGEDAEQYFRLDRVAGDSDLLLEPSLTIILVLDDGSELVGPGEPTRLGAGDVLLLPASAEARHLRGQGKVLIARPPRP